MSSPQTDNERRREILRRVRRIEITTNRVVNEQLAGAYHSNFKGQGIEFDRVRQYAPGDDIRLIDWNVTARAGAPFVKVYQEERELTVMLLVDLSASQRFGLAGQPKGELAAELSALLAFSAIHNNDQVGCILFTDRVERFIPPDKGRKHVLRVITEMLTYKPQGTGTSLAAALEYLCNLSIRQSVAFLISDFLDAGYEAALKVANRKHDLIAFQLYDSWEEQAKNLGLAEITDLESGERITVDLATVSGREYLQSASRRLSAEREVLFKRYKVESLTILNDTRAKPYIPGLVAFFRRRGRRA